MLNRPPRPTRIPKPTRTPRPTRSHRPIRTHRPADTLHPDLSVYPATHVYLDSPVHLDPPAHSGLSTLRPSSSTPRLTLTPTINLSNFDLGKKRKKMKVKSKMTSYRHIILEFVVNLDKLV